MSLRLEKGTRKGITDHVLARDLTLEKEQGKNVIDHVPDLRPERDRAGRGLDPGLEIEKERNFFFS